MSEEEEIAYIKSKSGLRGGAPWRKLQGEGDEEYNYWRKRAGWFDDDVSMQEYNSGVYNTYYEADDAIYSGSHGGGAGNRSSIHWVTILLNVALVSIVIVLAFLLYKTIAGRRSSPPKETSTEKKKSSKGRSDSSSRRSRSKSTSSRRSSRSKSRSRKTDDSYKLMEDEDDKSKRSSRSVRSSRSRSRSVKRSRSRGSARSKSRTRSKSKKLDESKSREIKEVLV